MVDTIMEALGYWNLDGELAGLLAEAEGDGDMRAA
jgi:hypothetical protein